MNRVDAHAHCYPKSYVEALTRIGLEDGGIGLRIPQWSSAEETLEDMDALGIQIQILSLSTPGVCFDDRELSRDLSQMSNDFISGICRMYPRRFLGVGSIPLNHMSEAFDELHRCLEDLGMAGIALGTHANGRYLNDEEFLPFFEELDRLSIPVVLHPMVPIGYDSLSADDVKLGIPSAVGFLFETTRTLAQLTFKGVFERCKNLTFVLPHAGGSIPFVYPRWEQQYFGRDASHPIRKIPHPPSHYLKRHYYDTTSSYYPSSLRCTAEMVGTGHMVLGTDYPYSRTSGRAEKNIQGIEHYSFSRDELEQIYFRNLGDIFPKTRNMLEP
jgi:predicted TIM-barrel fold metal-dependent hydrolase